MSAFELSANPPVNSGIVGFVRSLGKQIQDEAISLNAICPGRVRTNITSSSVHDQAEERGLIVPIPWLLHSFEAFLPGGKYAHMSGECLEVAPRETRLVPTVDFLNEDQRRSVELAAELQRGAL